MSELNEIVACMKKKGLIVDKGAMEFIEQKGITLADMEDIACDSLFLTKFVIDRHMKAKAEKNEDGSHDFQDDEEDDQEIKKTIKTATESGTEKKNANIQAHVPKDYTDKKAKDIQHYVRIEGCEGFEPRERSTESFVEYFNARYNTMKNLLARRPELKNLMSIGRIGKFSNDRDVSIIGLVSGIAISKNGNTILDIEDPTGTIKVLVKKENENDEVDILMDEVIGFFGGASNGFFFADSVVFPDVPFPAGPRRVNEPIEAVFISDLHFGSRFFNRGIEKKFIDWIHSPDGEMVKYLFISGDNVDGVGIYPSQKSDLEVKDIYGQYAQFEDFVMKIPKHVQIIICPGNHDAVRLGEPQPVLPKELVPRLYEQENVYLTTNPSYVNIHAIECDGINVLMYHGYSFTSIVDVVPHLRKQGIKNPQHVMKYVLTRRHLAPVYGSTISVPEKKDALVITKIPDIFQTGDLHSHAVDDYKGITMISSSTFQDQTPFMDRVGHVARKGMVTVVNLKTRDVRCMDFGKEE